MAELDHVALLRMAIAESEKAKLAGVHPFASILVGPDGVVLMTQHNAFMPDHDMTGHAERVLMTRASTTLPMELLRECTIYTSAEPCAMCAGAIALARLKALRFAAEDVKGGAVVNGPRLFGQLTCHHRPDVLGGIGEAEAGTLLREFFSARR